MSGIAETQARVAIEIVRSVAESVSRRMPADAALARIYSRRRELGSRDRRLVSSLVFSFFRWKGWAFRLGLHDLPSTAALGHLLDQEEIHPAVGAMLRQSDKRLAALPPLGALSVADKARHLAQWAGLTESFPLRALVPDWVPEALAMPDGGDCDRHTDRCMSAFQIRPSTWLRIRPRFRKEMLAVLSDAGVPSEPDRRLADAWAIPSEHGVSSAILKHFDGRAEIQDLASQVVGHVCAPHAGERWWDVCAGSLGKSLHLAELMDGRGGVLATDVRESVLDEGRRRFARSGLRGIDIRLWNGAEPAPSAHPFDGILVDAPCSSLGTWHRNPDARWRTSAEDTVASADTQQRLLGIAAERVRSGGALVYSVCTLTRIETAGVVERFLAAHSDFQLAPFASPLTRLTTNGTLWIWPWEGRCNGMFIARFVRA